MRRTANNGHFLRKQGHEMFLERRMVAGQHNLMKVYSDPWKGYITTDTRKAIRRAVGREKTSQVLTGMLEIISKACTPKRERKNSTNARSMLLTRAPSPS